MKAILAGAVMALAITPVRAAETDYNSANYILPGCNMFVQGRVTIENVTTVTTCHVIVETLAFLGEQSDVAVTAFTAAGQLRRAKEHWRCLAIPNGVTNVQMVSVVIIEIVRPPQFVRCPTDTVVHCATKVVGLLFGTEKGFGLFIASYYFRPVA
jgi:hypothetical protein